jgi:hypothetical protein
MAEAERSLKREGTCQGESAIVLTRAGRRSTATGVRLLLAALVVALAMSARAADTVRTETVGLRFDVPGTWQRVPAPSDVRAAQWRIPHAPADSEDGELVLFYFGKGKGGGAQENLERWYGQFSEPDGPPARDAATVTMRTVNGLRVTSVDLSGTYTGGGMGGAPPHPKPGFRLLAAVVEGEEGPWFLKALGPEPTIVAAKPGFDALLASLEAHR